MDKDFYEKMLNLQQYQPQPTQLPSRAGQNNRITVDDVRARGISSAIFGFLAFTVVLILSVVFEFHWLLALGAGLVTFGWFYNEPFYEVKGVLQRTKIIGDFGRIETLYVYRLTVMLYRCVDDDIPDYKSSKTLYWNNYYNEEALRQAIRLLDAKVSAVVEILAGGEELF